MSSEESTLSSKDTARGGSDVEHASVNQLHKNALGQVGIFTLCVAAIAPAASMLFNVPVMASQAGASTPLVFVLAAIGVLLLSVSVLYFARHLSSAGGFYTWVMRGLGKGAALQVGWLMLGAYALFEAALQATVGGSLDINLSTFGFHMPGGWVTYALILTIIIGALSYFDIKLSLWVMAPFAIAEVLALVILDIAITLRGGVAGHDLVHTFTPAGSLIKGVAPGGLLGIGVAMTLGILAFVGFETAIVYGEEARTPRRAIPVAIISLIIFLAILYIWTAYAATIGLGWQHAGDTLGNIANAPQQYIILANQYVGSWLGFALVLFVVTSNAASAFAFHQAMVRYFYAMGREGILPRAVGRTHPKWHSPYIASFVQSVFSILVVLFLGLVIQHTNKDGSVLYALGFADGHQWQQTSGVISFGWLAAIVTMCIIIVYVLTNIAVPFFARSRNDLHVLPHIVAPSVSILLLLLPLASYVMPPIPGIGAFFTALGFAPTPFPQNLLPLFVLAWIVVGLAYAAYLRKRAPERFEMLGRVIREES
jgi:amino acid transporter